ncbi:MAG: hypothetical protein OXC79_05235 [Candidatus Poribacteria bacterium]|nr:hypothetical protein [Candidatus Poribacteria bacterium]
MILNVIRNENCIDTMKDLFKILTILLVLCCLGCSQDYLETDSTDTVLTEANDTQIQEKESLPKENKTLRPDSPILKVLADQFTDGFIFEVLNIYVHGKLVQPIFEHNMFENVDVGWGGLHEEGRPYYEILCGRPVEVRVRFRHKNGYNLSGFKIGVVGFAHDIKMVRGITDEKGIASIMLEHFPFWNCEAFEDTLYEFLVYPEIDNTDIYDFIPNIIRSKNRDNSNPNVILLNLLFTE